MNCLNGEEHLRAAMDSVVAQTFTDWEIVFWDNGSKDASPDIAASYGDRVRLFRGEKTVPLGEGRNLAIAKARGEFIAFLDCDDLWAPTKLEKQVALFDANPRVGLVTTDTLVFDGSRVLRRVFHDAAPARGMVYDDLIERQWITMSSAVVRRAALASLTPDPSKWEGGWFDEHLEVSEEADVFYRVAHDWECDYVDEPLTSWRVHGRNSTLKNFGRFAEENRYILAKHMALYPGYEQRHARTVALLNERCDFEEAVTAWRAGDGKKARALMAPHGLRRKKFLAFRLASYLPGSFFDLAAWLYFRLPRGVVK